MEKLELLKEELKKLNSLIESLMCAGCTACVQLPTKICDRRRRCQTVENREALSLLLRRRDEVVSILDTDFPGWWNR